MKWCPNFIEYWLIYGNVVREVEKKEGEGFMRNPCLKYFSLVCKLHWWGTVVWTLCGVWCTIVTKLDGGNCSWSDHLTFFPTFMCLNICLFTRILFLTAVECSGDSWSCFFISFAEGIIDQLNCGNHISWPDHLSSCFGYCCVWMVLPSFVIWLQ